MDRNNKDSKLQFMRPTAQVMAAAPAQGGGGGSKTLKGILAGMCIFTFMPITATADLFTETTGPI